MYPKPECTFVGIMSIWMVCNTCTPNPSSRLLGLGVVWCAIRVSPTRVNVCGEFGVLHLYPQPECTFVGIGGMRCATPVPPTRVRVCWDWGCLVCYTCTPYPSSRLLGLGLFGVLYVYPQPECTFVKIGGIWRALRVLPTQVHVCWDWGCLDGVLHLLACYTCNPPRVHVCRDWGYVVCYTCTSNPSARLLRLGVFGVLDVYPLPKIAFVGIGGVWMVRYTCNPTPSASLSGLRVLFWCATPVLPTRVRICRDWGCLVCYVLHLLACCTSNPPRVHVCMY